MCFAFLGSGVSSAAAAPVHTSTAGVPEQSASPPHAASPDSAALPAWGLQREMKKKIRHTHTKKKKTPEITLA